MSRLRAVSKVVVQVPGKALTVVGPLLLFWGLPLPQYAMFESIFALASLGALLLGWGLSAALPLDYLARSSGQVLSAMRRNFNLTALAVVVGVAGLAAFGETAAEVGGRSAAASWPDCVTLFALLCSGLMGQNFVAAILRTRGWIGVATLCEHSAWLFVVLACGTWRLFEAHVNIGSIVPWAGVNLAITALLTNGLAAMALHNVAPLTGTGRAALGHGTPFVAGQLCSVVAGAVARVVFLASGQPIASAHSALAMRLSAPITFVYQTLYAALLKQLFPTPGSEDGPGARRVVAASLMVAATALQVGLAAIITFAHPASFPRAPSFLLAIFLATQLLLFLGICEVTSFGGAGTPRHAAYARSMWIGTGLVTAAMAIIARVIDEADLLVACGMGICWMTYGALAIRSLRRDAREESARGGRKISLGGLYAACSSLGAAALLIAARCA